MKDIDKMSSNELRAKVRVLRPVYEAAKEYCNDTRMTASEGKMMDAIAAVEAQESTCDHEMVTTGSGTYCMKPDCDVNWT